MMMGNAKVGLRQPTARAGERRKVLFGRDGYNPIGEFLRGADFLIFLARNPLKRGDSPK